jgi:DNA-binding CsgD family transcriptional regulator
MRLPGAGRYKESMRPDILFRSIVDALPLGVLVVDRRGEIEYANPAARVLLDRGVYVRDARLEDALRSRTWRRFERLTCGDSVAHVSVVRRHDSLVLFLWCSAATEEQIHCALVELYGLTAQERRIAVAIYRGHTLVEAASLAGVEVSTARSHLKSAFAKTRTCRQAELVLVVASCAAAAATPQHVPTALEAVGRLSNDA